MSRIIITIIGLLISNVAFAQNFNLIQSFENGQSFFIDATELLATSVSWVIGIFLTVRGIFKLAQHGTNPSQVSLNIPLSYIVIGTCFCYFGYSFGALVDTIFTASSTGGGNILMPNAGNGQLGQFARAGMNGVLFFVRLVGVISIMRGLLQLKEAGAGKEGMVGRGLTHIVGGAIAFRANDFASMVATTFGWA